MRMRVTTGMAMNTYRYNLQNSTTSLTDSRNKVLSHRKFDSFAEDPSAATQAWRVRRAMVNTESYLKNNSDTYTRFNIAWATLGTASRDLTDLDGRSAAIYAANDPTAAGRTALGQVLRQTAESVAQTMNGAKSGENFLFAGDDELYAPFTWEDGQLLYRGVNVNAGGVTRPDQEPSWGSPIDPKTGLPENMPNKVTNRVDQAWADYYRAQAQNPPDTSVQKPSDVWAADPFTADIANGNVDDYGTPLRAIEFLNGKDANGNPVVATDAEKAWAAYYVDHGDYQKLQEMSKERATIDLGMGLLEDDNGKLIDGTYFDRSLPGINMLGFGIDENGDPNNVCMIMIRLGEIYENCNPNSGSFDYDSEEGNTDKAKAIQAEAMRLLDKLKAGQSHVDGQFVEVSAKASYLQQNENRLALQRDYLDEQRAGLEDVDLADAITAFTWDYYCYSAALKVGTQLLSQSLIDYMS